MAKPPPQSTILLSLISEKLKEKNFTIREKVVESCVNKEIDKRVETLNKALKTRATAHNEVRKLDKPDVKAFDSEGKVISEVFSGERFKELKKAREKLEKIDTAIDKALEGDFSKLNELKS